MLSPNFWFAMMCAVLGLPVGALAAKVVDTWRSETGASTDRQNQPRPTIRTVTVVTVVMVVGFGLTGWRFSLDPVVIAYLNLAAVLVIQSGIDIADHRLPRQISYLGTIVSIVIFGVVAMWDGSWQPFTSALIGSIALTLIMWLLFLASRGGLGDGDVRLAPLLGLHLGYLGASHVVVGLFGGFLFGALWGAGVIISRRGDRTTQIAYGPFLAAGTMSAVWWGVPLLGLDVA